MSAMWVAAFLAAVGMQEEGDRAKASDEVAGVIDSVDASGRKLVAKVGRGEGGGSEWTYTLGANVKILVDGREGKVQELARGMRVWLTLADKGDDVVQVRAETARKPARREGGEGERREGVRRDGDRPEGARRDGEGDRPEAALRDPVRTEREGEGRRRVSLNVPFSRLDSNGDGKLGKAEWEAFVGRFDANQDGQVSADELAAGLRGREEGGEGERDEVRRDRGRGEEGGERPRERDRGGDKEEDP